MSKRNVKDAGKAKTLAVSRKVATRSSRTSARLRPFERNRISGYSRDVWGRNVAGIATAPWDGMKMGDCSRCHRQRGVTESCQDCHK